MNYQKKSILLKNGRTCVIRRAEERDAEIMIAFLKASAGETRNITREPEEITTTAEEEREFLRKTCAAERELMLAAFVDGKHAGTCNVEAVSGLGRMRHRCSVGLTLYREFWGLGIGTALLGELLASAKAAGYEQAELEVVSTNAPAIGLYKKLGFEAAGIVPRAFKYRDGTYADFLFMVKSLV